jgi:RNA-directed DNA polymerase
VRLYVKRWLQAPVEREDGALVERTRGTPQGSVISPLLANLFLHYAFDLWMQRAFPHLGFERYADDVIVHCRTETQARSVMEAIRRRLVECGLELHPTKTRIVYCKNSNRRGNHEHVAFDFLGYTFQPRPVRSRYGKKFTGFVPAISNKAAKELRRTIRSWRMASTRNNQRLEDLAKLIDPAVRGWMNYYGRFYRSECVAVLHHVNEALARWARWKYKWLRHRKTASIHWLGRLAARDPDLLYLWRIGILPPAEDRSRMKRELHVRFRERGGVKFPSATRQFVKQLGNKLYGSRGAAQHGGEGHDPRT